MESQPSSSPERGKYETFVAIMFPNNDVPAHIELSDHDELANVKNGEVNREGIVYEFHTDYRGITQALGIEDERTFEGSQVVYGRVLGMDSEWLYVQPIQYTISTDRRSADQGYSQTTLRLKASSAIDGQVRVAALKKKNYKDLLSKRQPDEPDHDWYVQQYGPYAASFVAMSGPK